MKKISDIYNLRRKNLIKTVKKIRHNRIKIFSTIKCFFFNKKGLEIGGPSGIFNNDAYIPIYKMIDNLDGVNFSNDTIWTGDIDDRNGYIVNRKRMGNLFITDATNLSNITEKYDFILSCNNIEHIANPLKAISQWLSKLKEGGILVLIAPRKESNFDHKRETVKFEHILDDYNNNIGEDDLTHYEEILKLHDLKMDPPAGTYEQFKTRSLNNFKNRCLHHHVFDLYVLIKIYEYFNLKIIHTENIISDYIIIGQK
jgi:SAM-dependent methyltransferase